MIAGSRSRRGYVLIKCGKIALLMRLLCLYPVVLSWQPSNQMWELVLLGLAMAGSLTLILAWETVISFIMRHPAVMGADLVAALLMFASSSSPTAYVGYLGSTAVLIGLFFGHLGRNLLVTLLAVGFLALTLFRWNDETVFAPGISGLIATLVLFVCLAYIGGSMRSLQTQVDASVETVREAASDAALGRERSRIAREMHDSLVKTLDGIDLQAKALAITGGSPEAARAISSSAQQAVAESREMLQDLRTTAVPPLEVALGRTVEELNERHPGRIELHLSGCSTIPGDIRYTVTKIVEEALSNAVKHSNAEAIRCTGRCSDNWLRIEVADDGVGFAKCESAKRGHMGLSAMRDRAEELGGVLTVDSQEGAGTTAVLEVPLIHHKETV